eukprot:4943704-Amphidinium_carterae.1
MVASMRCATFLGEVQSKLAMNYQRICTEKHRDCRTTDPEVRLERLSISVIKKRCKGSEDQSLSFRGPQTHLIRSKVSHTRKGLKSSSLVQTTNIPIILSLPVEIEQWSKYVRKQTQ